MDGRQWRQWLAKRKGPNTPGTFALGSVPPWLRVVLLEGRGMALQSPAVTISQSRVGHILRASKRRRGAGLDDADFDRLPDIIARPKAVLLDTKQGGNSLLYVFDPLAPQEGRDKGKVVVRMNYNEDQRHDGKKRRVTSNSVRMAGYLSLENLHEPKYLLLEGKLE